MEFALQERLVRDAMPQFASDSVVAMDIASGCLKRMRKDRTVPAESPRAPLPGMEFDKLKRQIESEATRSHKQTASRTRKLYEQSYPANDQEPSFPVARNAPESNGE